MTHRWRLLALVLPLGGCLSIGGGHAAARNSILPIDDGVSRQWGRIRNLRDGDGQMVASEVMLSIATAITHGMTLINRDQPWMGGLRD
jgi:hypothetical protein